MFGFCKDMKRLRIIAKKLRISCGKVANSYEIGNMGLLKGLLKGLLRGPLRGLLRGPLKGPLRGLLRGPLKGLLRGPLKGIYDS